MQRTLVHAVALLGLMATAASAFADDRFTTSCTATAGLAKHTAATTTTGTERTGSYDVTLTASGAVAEVLIEGKRPVSAGDAVKVPAPIDRVLLRSPFKSEATALPGRETAGETAGSHVATFDLAAVRALPAGDVDVVVITPDGERTCRIKNRDRQKLAAAR